jgi:CubicO group peptidase (beta-lactamase class C family)
MPSNFLRLLSLVLAVTMCGGASAAAPADRQANAAALDFLRAEMRERAIPGMQVVVVRAGKVVMSASLGMANLQHGVKVGQASLFSINSATKSFTGVAILQLAEQGKLEPDAPVGRYLDGLPPAWQPVTLRQLLDHTSGLPDIIDQSTSRMIAPTEAQAWQAVQLLPLQSAPGTRFSYNQANYVLLGRIIDRLSGEPFTAFIERRQFAPAGMPHARFGDSRDVMPGKADSYRPAAGASGYVNAIEEFPPSLRTGAGIVTSAGELANWLISLQQGRLLKPGSISAMWTAAPMADGKPGRWALGWPAIRAGATRAVAGIGGGRSAFYVYPEQDLAVVILSNLAGGAPEQLIDAVASFYAPALRPHNGARTSLRLRQYAAAHGFDGLDAVLGKLRATGELAAPDESSLNSWGYRLLGAGKQKEALAVFALAVRLYPDSGNAHDSLAEGYEASGANALAIEHYRQSLALEPGNQHAVEKLKALAKP